MKLALTLFVTLIIGFIALVRFSQKKYGPESNAPEYNGVEIKQPWARHDPQNEESIEVRGLISNRQGKHTRDTVITIAPTDPDFSLAKDLFEKKALAGTLHVHLGPMRRDYCGVHPENFLYLDLQR